jgi:hypothetical protein
MTLGGHTPRETGDSIIDDFAYWLLYESRCSPLIILSDAGERAWSNENLDHNVPKQPILFYDVKRGESSLVLQPANLTLFHRDLIEFLDKHSIGEFERFDAVIRPPQSDIENLDYSLVKISATTPLRSVREIAGRPSLSVVEGAQGSVLVSCELRDLLEASSLSGFEFGEPVFCG